MLVSFSLCSSDYLFLKQFHYLLYFLSLSLSVCLSLSLSPSPTLFNPLSISLFLSLSLPVSLPLSLYCRYMTGNWAVTHLLLLLLRRQYGGQQQGNHFGYSSFIIYHHTLCHRHLVRLSYSLSICVCRPSVWLSSWPVFMIFLHHTNLPDFPQW